MRCSTVAWLGLLVLGCSNEGAQSRELVTEGRQSEGATASASAASSAVAPVAMENGANSAHPAASLASVETPSASVSARGTLSDAKAAAMSNELQRLDMAMIGALSSATGGTNSRVLSDSAAPSGLLDQAADPGVASRHGDLHGGAGAGPMAIMTVVSARIGGKPAAESTIEDVKRALEAASCVTTRLDSPASPPSKKAVFAAKCVDQSFTVTFIENGGPMPDAAAVSALQSSAAVLHRDGVLLTIEPGTDTDLNAARALLSKIASGPGLGPRGNAALGGAALTGGAVGNASSVVAGMAAGFRRCYNRGLQEDPAMKGTVKITAEIGPAGEVKSAKPNADSGLSGTVTSCVASVVSSRTFNKPEGGSATIVIPVTFTPQN